MWPVTLFVEWRLHSFAIPILEKKHIATCMLAALRTEVNALLLLDRLMPVNVPVGPDDSASLSDLAIANYTE